MNLRILECKRTQYDRFGFWRLEDLKISSSFCAFVPSAYYVHALTLVDFECRCGANWKINVFQFPSSTLSSKFQCIFQFCVSNIT
jgi:hypothetical protein